MSHSTFRRARYALIAAGLGATFAVAPLVPIEAQAQEQTVRSKNGVDETQMGAYLALAKLTMQAYQAGDMAQARELATILERTWDRGEWQNKTPGSRACDKARAECKPLDDGLDAFIHPIMYQDKPPSVSSVHAAYVAYVAKLKSLDYAFPEHR